MTPPPGFSVQVSPQQFHLAKGQSKTFEVTITHVSAPANEWRFGSLIFRDGNGHSVRSPIAVRGKLIEFAPAAIEDTGAEGSASIDLAFGYNGPYTPGVHGLSEPFLGYFPNIPDDPDNVFDFGVGEGEVITFNSPLPAGTTYAQWSLFDAYVDGAHDLDLYLFYCPPDPLAFCELVDVSFTFTSEERVSVDLPEVDDPSTDADGYVLFVHAFETEGGAPASIFAFDWAANVDENNMEASGPASATIGGTGTVEVTWSGLPTGVAEKQVGAISHNNATGPLGVTSVNVANDGEAGYEELCALLPGVCVP